MLISQAPDRTPRDRFTSVVFFPKPQAIMRKHQTKSQSEGHSSKHRTSTLQDRQDQTGLNGMWASNWTPNRKQSLVKNLVMLK